MLIECGPSPRLYRGTHWDVAVRTDGTRFVRVLYGCVQQCGLRHFYNAAVQAARRYGFVVGTFNTITNWDAVPHLWEPNDDNRVRSAMAQTRAGLADSNNTR